MADVAAITRAVDRLDRGLAAAHDIAGNRAVAGRLDEAHGRGLGLIATATLDQALAGDVDFAWRPRALSMAVQPVLSTADMPEKLQHLQQLLHRAPVLRPVDVAQLALGHHFLAQAAARTLSVAAPDIATRLDRMAETLGRAADGRPEVASILPGDRRPVLQIGNIVRAARQLSAGQQASPTDCDTALSLARHLPDAVRLLHTKAVAEATTGRWLTPDHEAIRTTWRKTTAFTPLRLTDITAQASRQAAALRAVAGPAPAPGVRPAPAVSALVALSTGAPTARACRPTRPAANAPLSMPARAVRR